MSVWIIILPSLGGIVALITSAMLIMRGLFRNIDATKDNTRAITRLNEDLPVMSKRIDRLEIWQAIMDDRQKRRLCQH